MRSLFSAAAGHFAACLPIILLGALMSAAPAASAATPAPGWAIASVARPTNFSYGADQTNTVQSVTVAASGGYFELASTGAGTVAASTGEIACGAPATVVQAELEKLASIGAGGVSVAGQPSCTVANTTPYVVTFTAGALAGVAVPAMTDTNLLTGTTQTVTVSTTAAGDHQGESYDRYQLLVTNVGGADSSGTVTIKDTLPPGVHATAISGTLIKLDTLGSSVRCTLTTLVCTTTSAIEPFESVEVTVEVAPSSSAPATVTNSATVAGGMTASSPSASTGASANTANSPSPPAPFGLTNFSFDVAGEEGIASALAGAHPYSLTATLDQNTVIEKTETEGTGGLEYESSFGRWKDIVVDLPLGFVGDPLATAERCPEADLTNYEGKAKCPRSSIVGDLVVETKAPGLTGSRYTKGAASTSPVFNMVPEPGYPAELGVEVLGKSGDLYASVVRTASGYGLRVALAGLPPVVGDKFVSMTLFGDPAEVDGVVAPATAFFTDPTDCSGRSLGARIEANSWQDPEDWMSAESIAYPQVTGCSLLAPLFTPSFAIAPSVSAQGAIPRGTSQADEPSAYEARLAVPQGNGQLFGETATPELRDATVTLPAGVSVSPGAAQGLEGCAEHGIHGVDIPDGEGLRPGEAGEGEELGEGHPGGNDSPYDDGLSHLTPGHCPAGSILGTVEVFTPLLPTGCGGEGQAACRPGESPAPLQGHVYLAQPKCGGEGQPACTEASATNGELYRLYIEVAGEGVVVKLPGSVAANPATGQLTASFKENPQLPFSELKLHFNGGGRAPLANPQSCGSFATTSTLSSWAGQEASEPAPAFDVDWDGNGGACPASLPFAPSFSAGTLSPAAGSYSPFVLSFSRQDREQDLEASSETLPEGLLGKLAGIPLCGPGRASAGTCSAASEIGSVSVLTGSGAEPLSIADGRVYLTTGYEGQPFGVSIVVPAVAGPFNLGNVVVRAAIHINPETAQVTVTSDPFPQIVDGVPVRLRTVNVDIDRPDFTLNATNCASQQVAGTIAGMPVKGGEARASENVSSPYAANGCADLPFGPSFTASTEGAAGPKGGGASLVVKVAQKPGEANIHKVDLTLPKVLPARLTTLQKACAEAQFTNANPAGCPEGSVIGTATAVTPLLNVALKGPAYLVSHGGAAFPDVEFVLQGENITIVLDGKTDIKAGVTYSKFETVPDAPISSFETNLPEGPHSVLASPGGGLCGQDLQMPTTITGQSGAVRTQSTRIAVTGCGKPQVKIAKVKVKTGAVLVSVTTTERGTIKISGKGLKTTTKTLSIGTHQVKAPLTKQGKTLRKHHKRAKITVRLSVEGQNVTKTTRVRL